MAKKLEDWEITNVFRSRLAEEILQLDVMEKIHRDYEAHMKDKGKEVNREDLEHEMLEILDNIINSIDWYLDDALYPEEMEGEDDYE